MKWAKEYFEMLTENGILLFLISFTINAKIKQQSQILINLKRMVVIKMKKTIHRILTSTAVALACTLMVPVSAMASETNIYISNGGSWNYTMDDAKSDSRLTDEAKAIVTAFEPTIQKTDETVVNGSSTPSYTLNDSGFTDASDSNAKYSVQVHTSGSLVLNGKIGDQNLSGAKESFSGTYRIWVNYNQPSNTSGSSSSSSDSDENDNAGQQTEQTQEQIRIEKENELAKEQEAVYTANSSIKVAGESIKSTVPGAFTATAMAGTAITTPVSEIANRLGLQNGESFSISTWDVSQKKNPLAFASLQAAADSVKGDLGPAIQVNITKHSRNSSENGSLDMTVGVPDNFRVEGATYAVAHVIGGGNTEIFVDTDTNPNTVSFPVSTGDGAYALVRLK